jgi:hypothetical protein
MRLSRHGLAGTILTVLCSAGVWGQDPRPDSRARITEQFGLMAAYLGQEVREGSPWPKYPNVDVAQLLEDLKCLKQGDELRVKAIALARRYSSPSDLVKKDASPGYHEHAFARLYFAWGILMKTGILRTGRTLEDLIALLGPCTTTRDNLVDWYYSSPRCCNPCLRCTLREGRVEAIEVTSY